MKKPSELKIKIPPMQMEEIRRAARAQECTPAQWVANALGEVLSKWDGDRWRTGSILLCLCSDHKKVARRAFPHLKEEEAYREFARTQLEPVEPPEGLRN